MGDPVTIPEVAGLGWLTDNCGDEFCRGGATIEVRPVCALPPGHDGDHRFELSMTYTWPTEDGDDDDE